MDGFDIFLACTVYIMITALFVAILDEKENTLGRAFIWPLILSIAIVKAVRSVYLETKVELSDWIKTVKKK